MPFPSRYQSSILQNPRMFAAAPAFYFLLISTVGKSASACPADSLECPAMVGKHYCYILYYGGETFSMSHHHWWGNLGEEIRKENEWFDKPENL